MASIKSFAFVAVLLFAVCAQQTLAKPTKSEEIVFNVQKLISESSKKIQQNAEAIENHMNKNFFTATDVTARNFAFAQNFHQIYNALTSFLDESVILAGVCRESYLNLHAIYDEMYKTVEKCVHSRVQAGVDQLCTFVNSAKHLVDDLRAVREEAEKCVSKYSPSSSQALACASDAEAKAKAFLKTNVPPVMVAMSKQYGNILGMASNINFCTSPEHTSELQTKYMKNVETVAKCFGQIL